MNSQLLRTIIIFIGLILIAITVRSIVDLWRVGDSVTLREKEVQKLQEKNDSLKMRIYDVESPEYLERIAREKLNLARPGEYVVIFPKGEKASESAQIKDVRPNWQKWKEIIF
ncbi:hypothetical protein A2872_01635 [Candidatus Gottesmanbacteria bacterium RIFCSPHIGHO2_01_FULL_42_12]|uniref:Cell division protein FtsL n=1 Tax=Candidatus Gottesmanbacteria bacterium RIFCSPHIGHO2_01_FULL_42_12 TaxID=1798377 RepID=A0A1F5Z4A5_9BACT|nr:MAG: hypothetical protein A2872_01635 [Candidatus Gottesmanbacteria bacterium RIFCSPHIGHO2_01_FULL_42_12]